MNNIEKTATFDLSVGTPTGTTTASNFKTRVVITVVNWPWIVRFVFDWSAPVFVLWQAG